MTEVSSSSWWAARTAAWLLDDHPRHCVERWTWTDVTPGFVTMNVHALVVDFDGAGKVCDVGRAKK